MNFVISNQFLKSQSVYLIGGGTSLQDFDWRLLESKITFGCNHAYLLGPTICNAIFFGDSDFFVQESEGLLEYQRQGGFVLSFHGTVDPCVNWITTFPKKRDGVRPGEVCWNGNSGASLISLVLALGAETVYLLGYDCHFKTPKETHWHDKADGKQGPEHYARFLKGFQSIADSLPAAGFQDRRIINLNPNSSILCFEKQDRELHFTNKPQIN